MSAPILNFILPGSFILRDQDIPIYLKDLVSRIQAMMEKSDIDGLFELYPEALEVNYKLFQDKLLKPADFQFQKIEEAINKWSEATNESIDLHLCYNLEFFYKFILSNSSDQIRFDEKFIQELIGEKNKNKIDDQSALALSMLKIDLISIAVTLYFNEGIKCPQSFLERINNSLVQETHKIIKAFSKYDVSLVVNNKFDIVGEGMPDFGFRLDTGEDDEFAEPDLTEWNKSLDE